MVEDDYGAPGGTGSHASTEPKGLGPSGFDPSRDTFPSFDYEDGYPEDEDFGGWARDAPRADFHQAAHWLIRELPRAAENMPCFCAVRDSDDDGSGRPAKLIDFSTGGWSGAESLIALIDRRWDLMHFMYSWKRGGHFVFEIPLHFLEKRSTYERDSDGVPEGGDACGPVHDSAAIAQPIPLTPPPPKGETL